MCNFLPSPKYWVCNKVLGFEKLQEEEMKLHQSHWFKKVVPGPPSRIKPSTKRQKITNVR